MDCGPLPVCEIMGVRIAVTDMAQTVRCLRQNKDAWRGQYICVANVHTTVTAYGDESYRAVQNGAVLALPDVQNNPPDRCYHCKRALFTRLIELASKE